MTLLILAYLAGILTILSPCILPVLPFVFARADQPFLRTGLPLLLGMAVAFMGVATLASVGGGWAVETNQYGRLAALALLALFAMTFLSERPAGGLARKAWKGSVCRRAPALTVLRGDTVATQWRHGRDLPFN